MTPTEFINRYGVVCFYHFTDERNLASISKHGLLCHTELVSRSITVVAPGGNAVSRALDAKSGLDEYVHLCLIKEHPMEYRAREAGQIKTSKFLQISPDVLSFPDIRFTGGVANKSGMPLLTLADACKALDFPVVYDRTDWKNKDIQNRRQVAKKYELLIPRAIPIELIK